MSDQWPPGWYRQPDGGQRYWNGQAWVGPPTGPMPQPPPHPQQPPAAPSPAVASKKPASPVLGCVTLVVVVLLLAVGAWFALGGDGDNTAPDTGQVQSLGTGPSQDTGKPISDAICNDLGANGLSIFQLKASTPETSAMSGQQFAEYLYGNLSVGCPALLQDAAVRGFLSQWGVNPDA